jgi:UTP--glucose-1-phosphate uridylyltransferase
MSAPSPSFAAHRAMMEADGQPEPAIDAFEGAWYRLLAGESGYLPERAITPARDVPTLGALADDATGGERLFQRLAIVRLNGGLGTTMGLDRAKSLLEARDGLSFLATIVRQVMALRARHGTRTPLVLMDSFRTQADARPILAADLRLLAGQSPVPGSFLQHRVPRVQVSDLEPAPAGPWDDALRWCPPGHGDLYLALQTRGVLSALLDHGFRYAFIANADNLGATPDAAVLGWMARERIPFVMEVCRRTAADSKGGHLAVGPQGGLMLREVAQCPPDDLPSFQDITRHAFFNTNNLWLDLAAVSEVLTAYGGALPLPLIRNRKRLDPDTASSPDVWQLETAMGAAIEVFAGARAIEVPRDRFAPVKTTSDLLRLRSDLYMTDAMGAVVPVTRGVDVRVDLDPHFYGRIDDFALRFPEGVPSLAEATSLTIRGDVRFGAGVKVVGAVHLEAGAENPRVIEAGAILGG